MHRLQESAIGSTQPLGTIPTPARNCGRPWAARHPLARPVQLSPRRYAGLSRGCSATTPARSAQQQQQQPRPAAPPPTPPRGGPPPPARPLAAAALWNCIAGRLAAAAWWDLQAYICQAMARGRCEGPSLACAAGDATPVPCFQPRRSGMSLLHNLLARNCQERCRAPQVSSLHACALGWGDSSVSGLVSAAHAVCHCNRHTHSLRPASARADNARGRAPITQTPLTAQPDGRARSPKASRRRGN